MTKHESVQIMKTEAEFEGKEMQDWYRNHSEDGEDIPAAIEPLYARPIPAAPAVGDIPYGDDFNGTTPHLIMCIESLIGLSDRGVLRPHGLCGDARKLLIAAANRLRQPAAPAVAVPAEWREVLTELADDLSIELDMRYQSRSHYPSELRKYENEMQLVYRARALLQSAPQPVARCAITACVIQP